MPFPSTDATWMVEYAHQHRMGCTEAGALFGVSRDTFLKWKKTRRCWKRLEERAKKRVEAYEAGELGLTKDIESMRKASSEYQREWRRTPQGQVKYQAGQERYKERKRLQRFPNPLSPDAQAYRERMMRERRRLRTLRTIDRLENPDSWYFHSCTEHDIPE